MQTAETVSNREDTEIMVNIIGGVLAKADLEQVSLNSTDMNTEQRTKLLGLFKDSGDLFDGPIVDWDTNPVKLGLNPILLHFIVNITRSLGLTRRTLSNNWSNQ